jgi:hypothetical protein
MGPDHERAIVAKLINSRKLAREAKALSILLKRRDSIFEIVRRLDCREEPQSVRQSPVRGGLFLSPHIIIHTRSSRTIRRGTDKVVVICALR